MSEELEKKYLAVLQQSFEERLELRKENEKLKKEIFNQKLDSVNYQKNYETESDKYYIINLDNCEYLVKYPDEYTFDKDKATIFSFKDALSTVSILDKNFIYQRIH